MKDTLVLNNLDYALDHFKGPVGDFKANRKFGEAKPGDRVALVNHGAPGSIGGKSAKEVADVLTAEPGPIDKDVASIVLYSCNAGMEGRDASSPRAPKMSLVQGLSAELEKKGYEIGVEGQKGIAFGFKGIGERTTKGTEKEGDKAWFATLKKLFKKPEYSSWAASEKEFLPAERFLEVAGSLKPEAIGKMGLEEKAKAISNLMAPFWREVEQEMGSALYKHLKGWIRVKSYVKGKPLVQDSR